MADSDISVLEPRKMKSRKGNIDFLVFCLKHFRRSDILNRQTITELLGVLVKKIRENLKMGRQPEVTSTKVMEDGGRGVRQGLILSNQFPREECGRVDCQLCFQQDGNRRRIVCDSGSVGYEGECNRCPDQKYTYVGETSKTAYTRLSQHLAAYRAASAANIPAQPQHVGLGLDRPKAAKSWMWEHTRDVHDGITGYEITK